MAQEQNRERQPRRPSVAVLSKTAYRVLLSTSYSLWGGILILFGYTGRFALSVKRDDFLSLISTTAALAAITLAILTYLHETASRDRYLKLVLAGLTLLFLLATATGFLTALAYRPFDQQFRTLNFRFLVLGFFFIGAALPMPLAAFVARMSPMAARVVARFGGRYDYSLFAAAAATFAVWSSEVSLLAVTIVATLGGMVLLLCSTAVMLVSLWRARSHQEVLEDQIVEALRGARQIQQEGKSVPQEIPLSYLRNRLRSNDETLLEAIEALQSEDRIVKVGYDRKYYILEPGDWKRIADAILSHEVVILGESLDAKCWESLFARLEERTRLPKQLLREYFAETMQEYVRGNFENKGSVKPGPFRHETKIELFVSPGALERYAGEIKSEIGRIMREGHSPHSLDTEIGRGVFALLSCLPPIGMYDDYCNAVCDHVGSLVLKDHKGFLDESDWRGFDELISSADVLLVGGKLFDQVASKLCIPHQLIEESFESRVLARRQTDFTVLGDAYWSGDSPPWQVAIRTRCLENIREQAERTRQSLADSGGKTNPSEIEGCFQEFRLLPALLHPQSAEFWIWFLKRCK